ncbi:MAG: serine/threonine protein kinase [Bacteroidales bacterium]|nr:serine/threonine protein kinase [Bacteroidales bacterium]
MDTEQPSSTSGYANPLDFNAMNVFSNHTEMASKGYCRLFKAQRYGRWYVLKVLQPQHADNPQYAAMLEKEFQTAVNLKHPNIVNTYGIETDAVAGRCIVMEYVEGRTLAEFLKENPSSARRHKVAMQLLDAMQYYHALQIVHRDLKPSNILVTRNGDNVKLIDFGLADTDDYAILKGPAYTRGYAAPEQTVPDGLIDCRTDIYAFGLVLRLLFPRRYAGIVRRCTQNAPARRYPDSLSVQRAIVRTDRLCVILPVVLGFAAIAVAAVLLLPKTTLNSTPATEAQTTTAQATDTLPQPDIEPTLPFPAQQKEYQPEQQPEQKPAPSPVKPAAIGISMDEALRLTNRICDSMYNAYCNEAKTSTYNCVRLAELLASRYELRTHTQIYLVLAKMPQLRDANSFEVNKTWQQLFKISKSTADKMEAFANSTNMPKCDKASIEEMEKKLLEEIKKEGYIVIRYDLQFQSGELWE